MSGHQCSKINIGHSMNVSGFIFSISGPSGSGGGGGSGGADAAVIHHAEGNAEASFCAQKLVTERKTATFPSFCKHTVRRHSFIPPIFEPKCSCNNCVGEAFISNKKLARGGDPKRGTAKKAQN